MSAQTRVTLEALSYVAAAVVADLPDQVQGALSRAAKGVVAPRKGPFQDLAYSIATE